MNLSYCMTRTCKTCKYNLKCEPRKSRPKTYHLMWRPFKNLPEILRRKGIKVRKKGDD